MHRRGSHEVVRLETCPVMAAPFAEIILPWLRFLPPVEQVVVRLDGRGGWLLSLFGVPGRLKILKKIVGALEPGDAPAPGLKGILFNNRPVWGRDYLVHRVGGHSYRVGAGSFFQNNQEIAEAAVAITRGWLDEIAAAGTQLPRLLDLYGGVGLFTLALGGRFERVALVELDAGACRDAENNIARDESVRSRAVVHEGDLTEVLRPGGPLGDDAWRDAVCVVDPPRAGLGKDGTAAVLARRPAHVFYMSCDPATQARDAAILVGRRLPAPPVCGRWTCSRRARTSSRCSGWKTPANPPPIPEMSDASLPSLDNVVVVLSRPTEPMNIGAACRAMKTMGLSRLRLISPLNPKGRSARALAHGAEDILDDALVVDDLLDAVGDALVVTGTTARERQLRKRALLTPAELADRIADHSREGRVVIMFGTERTGLTNDEIDLCRYLSTVDTAPEQPSLNLAQAVMLYGWEIRQAMQRAGAPDALGARGRGLAPRGQGSALAAEPSAPRHAAADAGRTGPHVRAPGARHGRDRLHAARAPEVPHLPAAPAHARRHRQLGDAHLPHPGAPYHGRAAGAPLPGTAGRARTVGRGAGGDGGGDCRASGR